MRRSLPRYNGKQINNTDLLEAIDWVVLKLFEALALVDSISSQTIRPALVDRHGSTRPTRVTIHKRLETDLTIIATLEGRTVQTKAAPQIRQRSMFPHSLRNSAALIP
jgi:hypothetical protein